jgi:hypothetical protein
VPEKSKSRIPPAIGRLQEAISVVEEIDYRLSTINEVLLQIAADAELIDGSSIRDLFNAIDDIGQVIDDVEVEVDVLETRILTIENLKTRQK